MSDEDFDPFVGGPPPDPSERAWRHPSELAAEANADAARAHNRASGAAGRALRAGVLPLNNRSLGIILAGSLGAAACLTVVAALQLGDDPRNSVDPVAVGASGVVDIAPLDPTTGDDDITPLGSTPSPTTTMPPTSAPPDTVADAPSEEVEATARRHVVGVMVGTEQVASGVLTDGYLLTSAAAVGDELSVQVLDERTSGEPSIAYLIGVDPFSDLAVYRPSLATAGIRTTIPARLLAIGIGTTTDSGTTGEPVDDTWTAPEAAAVEPAPGLGTNVAVASSGGDELRFDRGVVIGVDGEHQTPSGRSMIGLIDTSVRRSLESVGGLLLADDGTAIGVVVDSTSSLVSAVPLDVAIRTADRLTEQGWASESWIGFVGIDLDDGVEVVDVSPGGPAHLAGLQPGDVIAFFDGTPIDHMGGVTAGLRRAEPGDMIVIVVERNGAFQSFRVTAESYRVDTAVTEPVGG